MSTDTLLNLALFAGAMLLMMRFGCGAHVMSHSHQHGGSGPGGGGDGAGGQGRAPAQDIRLCLDHGAHAAYARRRRLPYRFERTWDYADAPYDDDGYGRLG